MKFKYKDTYNELKITKTDDTIGLADGDYWCLVKLIASNTEFYYEVERKSLTKNEIVRGLKSIKDFYYNDKPSNLTFIKNYFLINMFYVNDMKVLEIKLIGLVNKKEKIYSLYIVNEEIEKFVKYVESFNIG